MDLISREALLYDLCEDREEGTFEFTEEQAEAADKVIRYIYDRIEAQPSVPAVPLDKLCEWLAKTKTPPCEIGLIGFKCVDVSLNCSDYGKCWKMAFAKWMEEQDAAD